MISTEQIRKVVERYLFDNRRTPYQLFSTDYDKVVDSILISLKSYIVREQDLKKTLLEELNKRTTKHSDKYLNYLNINNLEEVSDSLYKIIMKFTRVDSTLDINFEYKMV